ncbi:hypothetical protein AGMMS49940_10850 [Spirochaetia bacterium]|nr:hypothetical protein AGMMS49940_10850 [Spirochaetia bacterium]
MPAPSEPKTITRGYIRDFFKFSDSDEDVITLNFIMSHLVLKEYEHTRYICRAGDVADAMYFIEAGVVSVRGQNDEVINELDAGKYFGEYAALTGDKRMADIQAKGTVQVYELDSKILSVLARSNARIYSLFLKNAYAQATDRYRKLVRSLNSRRGMGNPGSQKKLTFWSLYTNYYLVALIFSVAMIVSISPFAEEQTEGLMHHLWLCSPIIFLVGYIVITKRALEAIVLAVMYLMIMLAKLNFISAFYGNVIGAVTETADIILLVILMGSLTRLFSASGSINALKYIAERRIKSGAGILFASFCSMVLIAIDEYLSVLINGACFTPLSDQKRIAREKSAMVMGMSPGALCIISPISLTGIYLAGMIAMSGGEPGMFFTAIPFNFTALLTVFFVLLLITGRAPLFGGLKKALSRVKEGGSLWPEDTDIEEEEGGANRGRVTNLILPILVFAGSSIITGTLEAGSFSVNVLYGMFITLIFTFFLYCFQRYMTPEQFFKNVVFGIENMLAPIVMFVVSKCFANGITEIGFSTWLNEIVQQLLGGQAWLLPAIIFGLCTLVGALFDNPWAMYAIGIPIALNLSVSLQGNPALYIGAVCAAGLVGNEIAMGDIFFIGPMLGINPIAYYRTKLPYVILITLLAVLGYMAAGYFVS